MIRISKKVEYGLIALRHMNERKNTLVSAKGLACVYDLSPALTAKVLQALTQHGILQSEQGTKGGYRLARPLENVSYLDLEIAILPEGDTPDAKSRHTSCELYESCIVLEPVSALEGKIRTLLAKTTVADLFAGATAEACCHENQHNYHKKEVHT